MNEHDAVLEALWERVDKEWSDSGVHDSLLSACSERNDLAFAAGKYRQIKDDGPEERRELAARQLEKITGLAFAQITAMKKPPKNHKTTVSVFAAIVCVLLVGACIYLISAI